MSNGLKIGNLTQSRSSCAGDAPGMGRKLQRQHRRRRRRDTPCRRAGRHDRRARSIRRAAATSPRDVRWRRTSAGTPPRPGVAPRGPVPRVTCHEACRFHPSAWEGAWIAGAPECADVHRRKPGSFRVANLRRAAGHLVCDGKSALGSDRPPASGRGPSTTPRRRTTPSGATSYREPIRGNDAKFGGVGGECRPGIGHSGTSMTLPE
jgi:hypothetical protein